MRIKSWFVRLFKCSFVLRVGAVIFELDKVNMSNFVKFEFRSMTLKIEGVITLLYPSHYTIHSKCSSSSHPHIQPDGLDDCDRGPRVLWAIRPMYSPLISLPDTQNLQVRSSSRPLLLASWSPGRLLQLGRRPYKTTKLTGTFLSEKGMTFCVYNFLLEAWSENGKVKFNTGYY